jgi:hypothetical protein
LSPIQARSPGRTNFVGCVPLARYHTVRARHNAACHPQHTTPRFRVRTPAPCPAPASAPAPTGVPRSAEALDAQRPGERVLPVDADHSLRTAPTGEQSGPAAESVVGSRTRRAGCAQLLAGGSARPAADPCPALVGHDSYVRREAPARRRGAALGTPPRGSRASLVPPCRHARWADMRCLPPPPPRAHQAHVEGCRATALAAAPLPWLPRHGPPEDASDGRVKVTAESGDGGTALHAL